MCEFDDSLTEIDWLNSLSIQKKSESKDGHILPVSISPPSILVTPQNSPNDAFIVSRCKGYDKPSYSYAYLIKLAIESSENKKMKLNEIYSWIEETFPYYKFMQIDNNKGWKNAIRHNLSLNKIFKRCAKESSHLGKGSYWMIDSNSDEDVQYPPVKKMKVYHNFTDLVKSIHSKETIKSDLNINNKSNTTEETQNNSSFVWNGNVTLDQLIIPPSIVLPQKLNFQSSDAPIILSDVKINSNNVSQDKCFSINSPILSYSNETLKHKCSTEPCPITECEISYKISPIYSNCPIISTESKTNLNLTKCLNEEKSLKDKLEVDEDFNNKSSKNDFILKTPVLSQINSFPEDNNGFNIESKYLGGYTMVKCSRSNNPFSILSQDCSDMFLENIELHDELIPHSFSDSESRSFELSQSTRKYLFNLSGVKETLLNRSHWLELDENEDSMSQSPYDVLNDTLRYDNLQIFDKRNNTDNSEISPSQDYIELKSSLMNYRYRSYTTRSNILSVSTSSTEKSSNTLKSKSDPHRKSGSIDSATDFNNQNPNHTENCDGDDEIKDIFPWDSLI